MGRLIDADALIERKQEEHGYYDITDSEFEELVKTQPTAYDVEKVVAELEEYKIKRSDDSVYGIGVLNGYAEAIDIVKSALIKVMVREAGKCMEGGFLVLTNAEETGICDIIRNQPTVCNDGWIPCSERLPKDDSICIVTVEYPNNKVKVTYGWFDRVGVCWYVGMHEMRTTNIHAWQPLPAPYQPKGE